jgi:hypothetical protein
VIAPSSDNTPNAPLLIVTDVVSTNAARRLDSRTIVRDTSSWLGYMHTWQWHDYVGVSFIKDTCCNDNRNSCDSIYYC